MNEGIGNCYIPEDSTARYQNQYGWAVSFMHCKGLALRRRTTLAQSFPQTTLKN
jgi:hypothetical protein